MTQPLYRSSSSVGDVFSRSFALLRRRPGLFFGLGAVSAGGSLLVGLLALGLLWSQWQNLMMAAAVQNWERLGYLAGTWLVLVLAGSAVVGVLSILVMGMLTRLTRDTDQERHPSFGELLATVGGFAGRMLPLAVAGMVLYLLATALVFGPMLPGMLALAEPNPDPATLGGGILLAMLLLVVLGVVGIFLGIRLLYLVPVVALEELRWTTALRRAWKLTAGAFWRTFGTVLLAYLLIYVVTMLVSTVTQVLLMPAMAQTSSMSPMSSDFAASLLLPTGLAMVPQTLIQVVSVPFLQVVITVMYLNRARELAAPTGGYQPSPYGYPPASHQPGYGAPVPGYGPAQPPQGWGPATPGYGQAPGYGPTPPSPGYGPTASPGYGPPPGYAAPGAPWPGQPQPPASGQAPPAQPPYPPQPGPYGWQPPVSGPPANGEQRP